MAQTKKCGYIVHPCQSNRQVIEGQANIQLVRIYQNSKKKREAASECEKQRQKSRLDQNVDQ